MITTCYTIESAPKILSVTVIQNGLVTVGCVNVVAKVVSWHIVPQSSSTTAQAGRTSTSLERVDAFGSGVTKKVSSFYSRL